MLSITKDKVKQILTQYRKNGKIAWDKNRRKTKGVRISNGVDRLEAIKEYWKHPVVRSIMIKTSRILFGHQIYKSELLMTQLSQEY